MNVIGRELDYLAKMQGLILHKRRLARPVGNEPYNNPPEGNVPMNELGSVVALGTPGTTPIILSFPVPDGYDGLIQFFRPQYTGGNFINNSGMLIWALRVNGLYIKGYHAISSQFSGEDNGLKIVPGIIIKSGQLVEIICTVDPTFVPDGGSIILAGVTGFLYPNGVARTN